MSVCVVDTNVAIVANTIDTHADLPCQLACIEKLGRLVAQGVAAIRFCTRARSTGAAWRHPAKASGWQW